MCGVKEVETSVSLTVARTLIPALFIRISIFLNKPRASVAFPARLRGTVSSAQVVSYRVTCQGRFDRLAKLLYLHQLHFELCSVHLLSYRSK